ncbi:hypothetical protein P7C70_g4105, partial [Phenoliferia sp. Uapishka_3]
MAAVAEMGREDLTSGVASTATASAHLDVRVEPQASLAHDPLHQSSSAYRSADLADAKPTSISISNLNPHSSSPAPSQPRLNQPLTLLRRPASGPGLPRSPAAIETGIAVLANKAKSEGTGGGARSPPLPEDADEDSNYCRTDSEAAVGDKHSEQTFPIDTPPSESSNTPSNRSTSSSPTPSSRPALSDRGPILLATSTTEGDALATEESPALDHVLLGALSNAKDRLLLLRAEMEMERFVSEPERTRLPLSPPHFAPGLNSYQRLLIHRLADTFGITREVEPSMRVPGATALPTAVVVLVKSLETRLPLQKLTSFSEPPSLSPAIPTTSATSSLPSSDPSSPSASAIPSPSSSSTNLSLQPQKYKILPRASSHHASSSASSSVGADDDSTRGGRSRKDKSLEEREAAYKEARERIFKEKEDAEERAGGVGASPKSAGAEYGASASSSRAREATVVGPAITRPNSTGSTYSRSSAALSAAGGRPSPSVVSFESSESSSTSAGRHPAYQAQGPTAYYPQQSMTQLHNQHFHQHPETRIISSQQGPSLRPSAPSFDPSGGGGWNSYSYGPEYAQAAPGSDPYNYQQWQTSDPSYHGPETDWARQQQQRRQGPPPPPLQSSYDNRNDPSRLGGYSYVQPPIQVTAPSPHPQHASYAHSMPSHSPPIQFVSPSPHHAYHPPPPSAPWNAPRQSIPSPALSTSSGGSYVGADRGSGYLMRFPESSSSSVGLGYPNRSASSLSSASSTSTSRNASSVASARRTANQTHSASHSLSSIASGGRSDGSSSIRRSTSTETSGSGGSKAGSGTSEKSRTAREREATVGKTEEEDSLASRQPSEAAAGKRREVAADPSTPTAESKKLPLHPSLPVKPGWLTSLPPPIDRAVSVSGIADRKTSFGSEGGGTRRVFSSASAPASHSNTPPVGYSPHGYDQHMLHQSTGFHEAPHPGMYGVVGGQGQPPHHIPPLLTNKQPNPQAYYHPNPAPPLWGHQQQPPSLPHSQSHPQGPAQHHQHPPPQPPPTEVYYNQPQHPVYYQPHPHASPAPEQQFSGYYPEPIVLGPELRRPPPRSTMLFNPNEPSSSAGQGGTKRAGSSTGGSGKRIPQSTMAGNGTGAGGGKTEEIERGVEKLLLG